MGTVTPTPAAGPCAQGKPIHVENTAKVDTKRAIMSKGGGTLALAIAMSEDKHLDGQPHADYPFGDVMPDGTPKIDDWANFGIYKMNWHMIQQCPSAQALIGSRPPSYVWEMVGKRINGDPALATTILLEAMRKWATGPPNPAAPAPGNFWAGHRWGESGLKNLAGTRWSDILEYYCAVQTVKGRCDQDATVWTSAVRYGVQVGRV
jgi:hypothetical protein